MYVKPKVLFVGPRPRPGVVGGVATMTGRIMKSSHLNDVFDMHFVDLEEVKLSFSLPFRVLNRLARHLFRWNIADNILLKRRSTFAKVSISTIKPDLIMCFFSHHHFFWLMGEVFKIARDNKAAFIADYRAEGLSAQLQMMSKHERGRAILILQSADTVLVRNEQAADWFRDMLPEIRVERIFNPANPLFLSKTPSSQFYHRTRRNHIQIVFLGVASPRNKGAFLLLAALPELVKTGVKLRLIMAGPDKTDFSQHVRKLDEDIRKHIDLRGSLSPNEVCTLFQESDIFVMPSYSECFPNALIEAMCCGLGCIGTRVGAIPEILDNGKCGLLIDTGDHHQLAEALIRLIRDENLRKVLGEAARSRVQTEYSMPSFEKALEKVLLDTLRGKHGHE